jgi:hypothetical protein
MVYTNEHLESAEALLVPFNVLPFPPLPPNAGARSKAAGRDVPA